MIDTVNGIMSIIQLTVLWFIYKTVKDIQNEIGCRKFWVKGFDDYIKKRTKK